MLIWLGQTRRVRPPGVFALYVAGYSGFRIFEETLRIDYSNYVLGLRLNFFVALVLCVLGLTWFAAIQIGWHGIGGRKDEPAVAGASGAGRGSSGSSRSGSSRSGSSRHAVALSSRSR